MAMIELLWLSAGATFGAFAIAMLRMAPICNHEGRIIPGTSEDVAICSTCKVTITIPHYGAKGEG
jgi:hypothetical protein